MPRPPATSSAMEAVGGSVFSALAHRLATFPGEVYPLHVGDTWMEPAIGARMQDLTVEAHPGLHKYANPTGHPPLVEALTKRTAERSGPCDKSQVIVTAGATGGLAAVCGAILAPLDEVLILAPFWPLIAGITRTFRGVPVIVPFVGAVNSAAEAVAALAARRTAKTVALYINTPNNPTGKALPKAWIEAMVRWAQAENLWILADETYEELQFKGDAVRIRALAPERTISAHTFSKAYGMAGNRVGWVTAPSEVVPVMAKVVTHTWYAAPKAAQIAALHVLGAEGQAWVKNTRERYRELAERCAERLGVESPDGSTFLFIDVAKHLDDSGLAGFLDRCADQGLFVGPGPSFGPYPTHIRVCFTAVDPAVTLRGIEVLAKLMGR